MQQKLLLVEFELEKLEEFDCDDCDDDDDWREVMVQCSIRVSRSSRSKNDKFK